MTKVTPFLMFNDQLEAAIEFYTATFPDSEVRNVARTGKDGPITSAEFVVGGQVFMGYNGGPHARCTRPVGRGRRSLAAPIRSTEPFRHSLLSILLRHSFATSNLLTRLGDLLANINVVLNLLERHVLPELVENLPYFVLGSGHHCPPVLATPPS